MVSMKFEWRKMRKEVLGGCMVATVAVGMMGTLFFGDKVMAGIGVSESTCNDITGNVASSTKIYNPSLYKACTLWQGNKDADWGALWISNIPKTTNDKYNKDYLSSRVTTNNATINGNTMTVYLRGAVMGKNGANARCIDITRKVNDVTYRPITFVEDGHLNDDLCMITVEGQTNKKWVKDYWTGRQANSNPFDNAISFQGTTMALDLANISKWGGTPTRTGGHVDYKAAKVNIYRCFDGSEFNSDHCWGDNSELVISGDVMRAKALVWLSSNHNIKKETGYVINTYGAAELVLDGCEKGCKVEFKHTLQKIGHSLGQKIYYRVGNSLNRTNRWTDFLAGKALTSMNGDEMGYTKTVTLYPGERYCSTMTFGLGTSEDDLGDTRGVGACAYVKGTYETKVDLSVKDGKYYYEGGVYYVKPNSGLGLNTTFNTNVQKATEIRLMAVNVEGKGKFLSDERNTTLKGVLASKGYNWANELYLLKNNNNSSVSSVVQEYKVGTKCGNAIGGSVQNRNTLFGGDWKCTNNKTESFANVGKYSLVAKTNANQDKNKVPSKITFVDADSSDKGAVLRSNISVGSVVSSTLKVWVPYNFENSTSIQMVNGKNVGGTNRNEIDFGAGGEIKYDINVASRFNNKLREDYVTKVDNVQSGVVWCRVEKVLDPDGSIDACIGGADAAIANRQYYKGLDGNVVNESLDPGKSAGRQIDLSGLDELGVGDIICVWSWVSPKDPGGDLVVSSDWTKDNLRYSKPVCGGFGKTPTIQVWGGNVFSEGELSVSSPFLREFDQGEGKESEKRYYGSFGELGVFVSSTENAGNFASGAALGYSGFEEGSPWPRPSPALNGVYSETVRKDNWFGGAVGQADYGGLRVYSYNENNNKYIDYVKELVNGLCNEKSDDAVGSKVECFYNTDKIDGGTITEGRVIYKLEGDVEIAGDLLYGKNETYGSLSEIPKFIIVTDGNININCDVTEVDALLVAGGTVNTCKDESTNNNGHDDKKYFNQLTIYGAVIANKLIANRAFGAGPGVYSIVPAEIIKFDPSLYDLGIGSAGSEPRIVDVTELAPRY